MSNERDLDTVGTTLRNTMVDLSSKQFDQLIVFLLKELGPTSTIDFVPADRESDIDLVVETTYPFLDVQYGVRLEQLPTTEPVLKASVRALAANLDEAGLHTGVLITTGELPSPVLDTASTLGVSTIDGFELAALLIENELGFTSDGESVELDSSFWELFRGQHRTDTIPSIEVPQADSIDRLDQTLSAIAAGNHDKEQIAEAVSALSGDSFNPRQADYYGTAGWLLGFLHKDYDSSGGGRPGRWGLTRLGKTYLEHRRANEADQAEELLHAQIRRIEIIRRILHQLQDAGTMGRDEIALIVDEETALGGSTVNRRTLTLVRWLEKLPEISTSGSGPSQQLRYEPGGAIPQAGPARTPRTPHRAASESSDQEATTGPADEDSILDDIVSSFD